jgi:hypothetical protein
MRRLIILGVVGFWLVMLATLVRRYLEERRLERTPGTYRSILTRERRNYQERMGIYWQGRRVGYTQTLFFYREDGKHDIQSKTQVKVAIPGFPRATAFRLDTNALVGADLALETLWMRLEAEGMSVECHGQARDGKLLLLPRLNGQRQEPIELALPTGDMVSQGLSPFLALPPLDVGLHWRVTTVDPFTMSPMEVDVRVVRKEELEWEGRKVVTHVVDVQSGMWMAARAWVARDGTVLKQQTVLGLTFVREPVPDEERRTEEEQE